MGTFRQHGRLRALIATGTLAAAMALPIGVSANTPEVGISPAGSNGATIQVSNIVNITSKVLATVDVTFTCDPFLIFDFETGEFVTSTAGFGQVDVTLIQASGRSVVTATASGGSGLIACDGSTTHAMSVHVLASTGPWKNGSAVVGATLAAFDDQGRTAHGASSGPIAVKLTK